MKGKVELQPIFEFDKSFAKIWGYEVLYRGNIPNDLLFSVANPAFEYELFKREIEATKDIDELLTFNISARTLLEFKEDIQEILRKKENIFIELTEIPYETNLEKVPEVIRKRIIIDDFLRKGSGIDRLLELKPFAIKVEKEFIPMLNLERFNSTIIVEKIESLEELKKLADKAKLFQGFLFNPYSITVSL